MRTDKIGILFFLCFIMQNVYSGPSLSSLSELTEVSNVHNVTIKYTGINAFKLRVKTPVDSDPDKETLLVLALHWSKQNKNTYKKYSRCLPEKSFKQFNTYVLSPDWGTNFWISPENEKKILTLINDATKTWGITADNTVLTGYSDGGTATWYFLETYPEQFSKGIVISGSIPNSLDPELSTSLYVIHSPKDEIFPFDKIEKVTKQLNNADITFIKTKDLSHFDGCNFKTYLQNADHWITEQLNVNDATIQ